MAGIVPRDAHIVTLERVVGCRFAGSQSVSFDAPGCGQTAVQARAGELGAQLSREYEGKLQLRVALRR